ncbi:hypothetical protein Poli38472_006296 [Pythium oligandrum]|uniref:Uncharacterized protein n=1 Tax=Pythium oligandrum TaxID=41045 RepID=A0A8K1CV50_PYTOL|nr:hypothetical protein Poli38472_006296 [Pythium oligandrum]|eukprot:TMW68828.1 hypothetical protein Poli38472_006296 [Pythium oligandrum]
MKDWSDEWKSARLALLLRDEEVFQGETVTIHMQVMAAAPKDVLVSGDEQTETTEAARLAALKDMETRWRAHCDGARADLRVVEPVASKRGDKTQPRATLYHQEAQLTLLSVILNEEPTKATVTFRLRTEVTLRVRAEFWGRPLTLIMRVAPKMTRDGADEEAFRDDMARQTNSPMWLTETFTEKHIMRLLREETAEPPALVRRAEYAIRVVKPLVLKMETRHVSETRVSILARARNLHSRLSICILDLQLHVNQFAQQLRTERDLTSAFRVIQGVDNDFPIFLRPEEQYNFVFVVEDVRQGQVSSINEAAVTEKASKHTTVSSAGAAQQSLLTLTWKAIDNAVKEPSTTPTLQSITEHHTIIWSSRATQSPEATVALDQHMKLPPPPLPKLHGASESPTQPRDPLFVRRDSRCPLRVTVVPLREDQRIQVGQVVTLCVVVANHSKDAEFDLSLVYPQGSTRSVSDTQSIQMSSLQPSWIAFEASHHLGRLTPGTIVRKSVHLVFLREGPADLRDLLVFDHLAHTWFLPPLIFDGALIIAGSDQRREQLGK